MPLSSDIPMGQDPMDANGQVLEPFTVEQNIQQLSDMDMSIAQLMNHTATALDALTIPTSNASPRGGDAPSLDPPAQKEAFKSATDSFLTTLHGIDVRMKRQIMALEEAGIADLSPASRQDPKGGSKAPSLKPNGLGTVGNLDVGWLNSRSTRVERDMEAELWREASDFLQKQTNHRRDS
ncbi:hypothetical protein UVI_02008420 [Ustilaginoidea virens]|uniref:Mediator of RNA polymerase II transcription subunit 11 n=1 Tax=Ustilaginoidea virens TaxID=1159556 RepID=A0A1B5L9A5_USTVR|nr:hypothetical protein UVI_02008420 [Ustilaginoidea virens]